MPLFDPHFLARLESLALTARRQRSGNRSGQAVGRKLGDGLEFADHREYTPGDELRHLDWHAYGRLGRLFIRRFHQHTDRVIHLLVDASASMRTGEGEIAASGEAPASCSKFDLARRIAAALAFLALNNHDRAALSLVREGTVDESASGSRHKDQIFPLMQFLERAEPTGRANLGAALRRFAEETRESGAVVIISDFLEEDPLEGGLDALAARGHELVGIQVLAPSEADPESVPALRGPLRLSDCETGAVLRPALTRSLAEAYRAEAAEFFARLDEAFVSRRGSSIRALTHQPFERFVLDLVRVGLAAGQG